MSQRFISSLFLASPGFLMVAPPLHGLYVLSWHAAWETPHRSKHPADYYSKAFRQEQTSCSGKHWDA